MFGKEEENQKQKNQWVFMSGNDLYETEMVKD